MEPAPELIDALLDEVEKLELVSLTWGYVDGSISQQEMLGLASKVISNSGAVLPPEDLLETLVERLLLFEFQGPDGFRFRSRFAEGVRLLTRLKQLMPGRPWISSPDLVSDYRIDARPRGLPRRDVDLNQAMAEFADLPTFDDLRRTLMEVFVGARQLSGFQVRAARAIMRSASRDNGTVLTSGTGSGKTLAFYLPLVAELGPLNRPGDFWTKAVAVFPRIELLKDQFTQAHTLLAPISATLTGLGYRPFRLGTFFGDTPYDASQKAMRDAGWMRSESSSGFVCPFLTCRVCAGDMVWLDLDIDVKREILNCERGCGAPVDETQIVLTRMKAQRQPPDILFTTAESLNQRLSDTYNREVFGIHRNRSRGARFLLLDEIHTYGGTSGAQAAMVLRRWRYARGAGEPVRYVGLSATLEDASRFFATLTGLFPQSVTEVAPYPDELEFRSKEYQLVLRGDTSSKTQLLSTTIQTCFLLSRLLDPLDSQFSPSSGRFGARVFAFTDDLDATNRLFDFLRDAEGMDIFGRPASNREPLAALRGSSQPDRHLRAELGQDWTQLEVLRRPLTQRLTIGRTSSQDRGVAAEAEVIVATAALEVGFNDPKVGAVVQHKAPHQLANFVQRKGRAGRSPEMRPWTVTILSDFGRDRLTYQSYDRLFDPVLRPFNLPVNNRYVLRMQAGFAMLDWLAANNDVQGLKGSWWTALSGPFRERRNGDDWARQKKHERAITVLGGVLETNGQWRNSLIAYVRGALRLRSDVDANEILWGSPRSLLLEVLPTLARRLETNWKLHPSLRGDVSEDIKSEGYPHPLPDFLPPSLFSDLNLPEVSIELPPPVSGADEKVESMRVADAICRLVPGRVTRRFAPERGLLNHWIPVPLLSGIYKLRIDDYAKGNEPVASVLVELDGQITEVVCYRPWTVQLEIVRDSDVRSTSNGRQVWLKQFLVEKEPIILSTANDPQWGEALDSFEFYLHAANSNVVVRRFTLEAQSTVKRGGPNSEEFNVTTRYFDSEGKQAAIGFEQEVDAIRVVVNLPDRETLAEDAASSDNLPAWRNAYFRDLVLQDPELSTVANWFQRDRLHRVALLALTRAAITEQADISAILDNLSPKGFADILYQAASQALPDDPGDVGPILEEVPAELEWDIRGSSVDPVWEELLSGNETQQRILILAREMSDPDPDRWGRWLRERIHETLGQALLAAAHSAAPEHMAEGSLLLDLDRGDPRCDLGDSAEIWLTESAIGGSGAVEAFAQKASDTPRMLIETLEAAISPGEAELISGGMDELVEAFVMAPGIAEVVGNVRSQMGHTERVVALQELYENLVGQGIYAETGLKVAMNHRILRAGTNSASDALVRDMVQSWHNWENRLQLGIDLHTFCSIASSHPDFADRVRHLIAQRNPSDLGDRDAEGVLYGLLWPRQWEVRTRTLQSYQPFREGGYADPALIRELLMDPGPSPIEFGMVDWDSQFARSLSTGGVVRLRIPPAREEEFSEVVFELLGTPVEVDYLQLYPIISRHEVGEGMILTFILKEVL
ncbi:MAG: protein DpdJ [Chloroflexota bacterium]|nr:protein DpdJ [Chloroflexota bacterium]